MKAQNIMMKEYCDMTMKANRVLFRIGPYVCRRGWASNTKLVTVVVAAGIAITATYYATAAILNV